MPHLMEKPFLHHERLDMICSEVLIRISSIWSRQLVGKTDYLKAYLHISRHIKRSLKVKSQAVIRNKRIMVDGQLFKKVC